MAKKPVMIGAGVIAALLLFACGCLLSGSQKAVKPVGNSSDIGVLNYDKAIDAHSLGAAYREKLSEYRRLSLTVERLGEERAALTAAMPGRLLFSDAARQKEMQAIIKLLIELEERLAEIEKNYREATAPEFEKRLKEVEDSYQNAIVNLQLKIRNADVMRIPTETVDEMKRREQELKSERSRQAGELRRQYEAAIAEFVRQASIEERAKLGLKAHETREYIEAQELFKQGEAVNRNLESLARNLTLDMERQEKLREAKKKLRPVERELKKLEAAVERDIASAAAKFAVTRKLGTILAKNYTDKKGEICRLININAVDITDDVVTELSRRK